MLDRIRTVLTDRFVIFSLIGIALFAIDLGTGTDEYEIELGERDLAMIDGRWKAQSGNTPTPQELRSLAEFEVREEILVREALRRGLDKDDVILRRRLAQKMEMLIRDKLAEPAISDEELAAYYEQAGANYTQPKRVGFRHIYLGSGEAPPDSVATGMLSALESPATPETWRTMGEPFMLARQYGPKSDKQIVELFGAEFAGMLMQLDQTGRWEGPVRSS